MLWILLCCRVLNLTGIGTYLIAFLLLSYTNWSLVVYFFWVDTLAWHMLWMNFRVVSYWWLTLIFGRVSILNINWLDPAILSCWVSIRFSLIYCAFSLYNYLSSRRRTGNNLSWLRIRFRHWWVRLLCCLIWNFVL